MPRTTTCRDCGVDVDAGERGLLPERCKNCKRVRARQWKDRYKPRRNELQRKQRHEETVKRASLPPEDVICDLCGVIFPRRSRKGVRPKRCPLCACFAQAVGQARRSGYFREGANFTYEEVFAHDKYICYLCGLSCSGSYPDPMSPTLDHIQPLARGGKHARENVRTAHLLCNMTKGIRAIL